jgi:hypothetical protein
MPRRAEGKAATGICYQELGLRLRVKYNCQTGFLESQNVFGDYVSRISWPPSNDFATNIGKRKHHRLAKAAGLLFVQWGCAGERLVDELHEQTQT